MGRFQGKWIFFVVLLGVSSCKTTYVVKENPKGNLLDYSAESADSSLQQMLKPYQFKQDSIMNHVVGYLGEDMERGYPEGKLGNYVSDILLQYVTGLDQRFHASNSFCLINNGGLRVPLQKGKITRGKVFEFMPFENALTVVELKGSVLQSDLLNYLIAKNGQPVSANVEITLQSGKLESFKINNQLLDTNAVYYVITSDYLSGGGDNMSFFKKGVEIKGDYNQFKLRDVVLMHLGMHTSEQDPGLSQHFGRLKLN